jgi:HlyD family secretion protein
MIRPSLALLLPLAASCASTPAEPSPQAAPAASAFAGDAFEKTAILVPSSFEALSIWPEQYAGRLIVLEVMPHGSEVKEGDVVAQLDARAIEDEIHRAELEVQSATVRHNGVVERNRLDGEAAVSALELARASLARAQRSLEGWKRDELAFNTRQDELSRRWEQANVEDQTDELDQLKKMYDADALVDATEDIVLKRSKRQLELTEVSNQLSRDKSQYKKDLELALQTEQREEQVRKQTEDLARLERQQALEAEARADAERRSADALAQETEKLERLRRDRERLVLRSPRAGVLLHGASQDYRPGKQPARHARGGELAFRQELFLIADPAPTQAALLLNDGEASRLPGGASVRVEALGPATGKAMGTVRLAQVPTASSPSEASYAADVVLEFGLEGVPYGARVRVVPEGGDAP